MEERLKNQLRQALWNCPTIRAGSGRDVVISGLSEDLAKKITRDDNDQIDTVNILDTCLDSPDGMKQLLDMIRYLEGDTKAVKQLEKVWRSIKPPISLIFKNLVILSVLWFLLYAFAVITDQVHLTGNETSLALSPVLVALGWIFWTAISAAYRVFVGVVDGLQENKTAEGQSK